MQWPAPPGTAPAASEPPLSDTVERMLRPQGLFQNPRPQPSGWQQAWGAPDIAGATGGPAPPPGLGSTMPHPAQNGDQYPPGHQYRTTALLQPGGPAPAGAGYPGGGPVPPGGAYPPGQYGQDQYGQYGRGPQYGPDGMPLAGGKPPRTLGWLTWRERPLIPALVAAVLIAVAATAVILAARNSPGPAAGGQGATTGAARTAGSAGGSSSRTERQAAVKLTRLLAQSGTDRADVNAAYSNVQACGKDLARDTRIFNRAAANRRTLLAGLARLPGRSALPAAMVADLTTAWQASATVDSDLARWASAAAGGCHKGNPANPSLIASSPYDSQATNSKQAFVTLWDRLARKDGLPAYTVDQL